MENVLFLPGVQRKEKKSPLDVFKNFILNQKKKAKAEERRKLTFLILETYSYYLRKVLEIRIKEKTVDIPAFMYEKGFVICQEAMNLTEEAIQKVVTKGKKHIEACYKARIIEIERDKSRQQRRILRELQK